MKNRYSIKLACCHAGLISMLALLASCAPKSTGRSFDSLRNAKQALKLGMSTSEVRKIMGEPTQIDPIEDGEMWAYQGTDGFPVIVQIKAGKYVPFSSKAP